MKIFIVLNSKNYEGTRFSSAHLTLEGAKSEADRLMEELTSSNKKLAGEHWVRPAKHWVRYYSEEYLFVIIESEVKE